MPAPLWEGNRCTDLLWIDYLQTSLQCPVDQPARFNSLASLIGFGQGPGGRQRGRTDASAAGLGEQPDRLSLSGCAVSLPFQFVRAVDDPVGRNQWAVGGCGKHNRWPVPDEDRSVRVLKLKL